MNEYPTQPNEPEGGAQQPQANQNPEPGWAASPTPGWGPNPGWGPPPAAGGGWGGGWDPSGQRPSWQGPDGRMVPYRGMWASPPNPPIDSPAPRRKRRRVARGAVATVGILAIAGLGVVVGHDTTGSGTAASASAPAASAPSGSAAAGSAGTGSTGGAGTGSTGTGGFGSGTSGSSSTGSGASSGSTGASAAATAVANKVDPGLVDIDTTLSYEGEEAAGTGMVLTSSGEILTNNHVIDGATSISVTDIENGKTYKANVVGYDRTGDIAVLQLVDASGLKTVTLGNSSDVTSGESVVAIGNAGGTGGTPSVAAGSITALDQAITASDEGGGNAEQLSDLIETNAGIEPGDSGGPMVTSSGAVVGMDTAAETGSSESSVEMGGTETASTTGYAIPINEAVTVAKKIEAGTTTTAIHLGSTAFLGVEVSDASSTSSAGSASGLGGFGSEGSVGGYGSQGTTGGTGSSSTTSGAVVAGVASGTPAASSGLEEGDTITSINGTKVTSADSLSQVVLGLNAGSTVSLTYVDSSGTSHTTSVTLSSGPPQ
jgi:S1-C subfamily serine protease